MKYLCLFINDHSQFTWLYLLHAKHETFIVFKRFKQLVETQFDTKIMALQTDWGGEFRPLKPFLENLGIDHRHLCPITP